MLLYHIGETLPLRTDRASPRTTVNITGLTPGDYRLVYENGAGAYTEWPFQLDKGASLRLRICADSLPRNMRCSLDTMGASGVSIAFESIGCFHHEGKLLEIKKEEGRLMARLYTVNPESVDRSGRDYKLADKRTLIDSTVLTAEDIWAFRNFEHELSQKRDNGGCTTIDTYRLRSSYHYLDIKDNTCNWNGFKRLLETLFG